MTNNTVIYSVANNDTSMVVTEAEAMPIYTLTKSVLSGPIYHDKDVIYEIELCSGGMIGNLNLENTVITDMLPPGAVFVSASDGGTESGGLVTWNIGDFDVTTMTCISRTVTVRYPFADQVNNNTGLTMELPKLNQATMTADPIGEPELTLNAAVASPLLPPVFMAGNGEKLAEDLGILPIGETNTFRFTAANTGTAPLQDFVVSDPIPPVFYLDSVHLNGFGGVGSMDISVSLNGSPTFQPWLSNVDPTTLTFLDVDLIPGFTSGVDYVSEIKFFFPLFPDGAMGTISLLVTPADSMAPYIDLEGNPFDLYTPYENCVMIDGFSTLYGVNPIPTAVSCAEMCILPLIGRLDPVKSVATSEPNPPPGPPTGGNPFTPGSQATFTILLSNDGPDDVEAPYVTGAYSFDTITNPIAADLLPIGATYLPGTWVISNNTSGITTPPVFEEIADFNGTGRKLLRWTFDGELRPDEVIEIKFDVHLEMSLNGGDVLTNTYCMTSPTSFFCEAECGEAQGDPVVLIDFFATASNSGMMLPGIDTACCAAIDLLIADSTATIAPDKMVLTGGPYAPTGSSLVDLGLPTDMIEFAVTIGNDTANSTLPNPIGMDLLPYQLEYIPGTWELVSNTTGLTLDDTGGNPTLEVIEDFAGTGRTLLRWQFTGEFPIDSEVTFKFKTLISQYMGGTMQNSVYSKTDFRFYNCLASSPDTLDLDENGITDEDLCSQQSSILFIEEIASLAAFKLVKGANDSTFLRTLNSNNLGIGSTNPADSIWWQFDIVNVGNVTLTDVVVIDIFPHLGDKGVQLTTTDRGTEFRPYLMDTIMLMQPDMIDVYYSLSNDPCRAEINPATPNAFPPDCVDDWTLTPPSPIKDVMAVKFVFMQPLLPGDTIQAMALMFAPDSAYIVDNNVPAGGIAWNSIARDANEVPAQEPNKVGVRIEYFDVALIKVPQVVPNPLEIRDIVTFRLHVHNQGSFPATDVLITDYIPAGMKLADPDWTFVDDATATIVVPGPIAPYTSTFVDIDLQMDSTSEGLTLVNFAEITSVKDSVGNPAVDFDAANDGDRNNEGTIIDNNLDNGLGDQDDSDIAQVTVHPCEITSDGLNIICDNNGTPYDYSDDQFYFALNPIGISEDYTFSVEGDVTLNNHPYGSPTPLFGPFPVGGANINLTIVDDNPFSDPCELPVVVVPPTNCCADSCLPASIFTIEK
ncbi:MAG: hypothetical protein IPJ06_08565 [Saprospiraceae bacterium]|nr:hypothetical protein [Saprospiraceae bacterium]